MMQHWLRVTNAPGTKQDTMKLLENSLLFDVPGVESCMFSQAGQDCLVVAAAAAAETRIQRLL